MNVGHWRTHQRQGHQFQRIPIEGTGALFTTSARPKLDTGVGWYFFKVNNMIEYSCQRSLSMVAGKANVESNLHLLLAPNAAPSGAAYNLYDLQPLLIF